MGVFGWARALFDDEMGKFAHLGVARANKHANSKETETNANRIKYLTENRASQSIPAQTSLSCDDYSFIVPSNYGASEESINYSNYKWE